MQLDMAKPIEELKIEDRIYKILMAHGIRKGSGVYKDYEKAKTIIERHNFSYDVAIKEICEYLEI